jgi:glucokinase
MNLAIEIGGTKLQIGLGNPETGELEKVYRFTVEKENGAAGILQKIEETLNTISEPFKAIGIGFGGPVNRKTGIISKSHQISGWAGFNLREWFSNRYNVPVFFDNDANTAALGEARFGVGRGYEYVFYVTLGSGVGGGMVVNQKLYHGNTPGEAEIGLMTIERSGTSLETYCSGWSLDAAIRKVLPELPESSTLKQLVGSHTQSEARFLLPAIKENDITAIQILADYADSLAWGLAHVCHLFNPQIIVLGGGVSLMGEVLVEALEKALPSHLVEAYRPGPIFKLSALNEEVVLVGALALSTL